MEEVRSYWQVSSIHHFCNTFGKQFKLPSFEPEELEQAFILDIPAPIKPTPTTTIHNNHTNHNGNTISGTTPDINGRETKTESEEEKRQDSPDLAESSNKDKNDYDDDDDDYKPPSHLLHNPIPEPQQTLTAQQQNSDEQESLHLLVKLAIALMKPHFNCKLT